MSSDTLSTTSRNFYENAKSKLSYSLVLGAAALMLIGFSSFTGGLSKYYDIQADHSSPSYVEDINKSLSAGYGIACFVHLVGFFFIVIAAFVASPLIFGYVK